jgi:hypothetical protein
VPVSYAGAATTSLGTASSSLDVNIPAGSTKDVVVIFGEVQGPTIQVPSGWTELSTSATIGSSQTLRAFYKAFTDAGATTQAVTLSSAIDPFSGEYFSVIAFRWSGVDVDDPIPEVAARTLNTGLGTTIPHNTVTIGDGNWSVLVGRANSSGGRTPPGGWTEDYDTANFTTSHREYATGASTGSNNTATSNTSKRVGWAFEVAAESVQLVGANFISSGASVKNHAVTPGDVTVATNLLSSGQRFSPGVRHLIGADHIASGAVLHEPSVVGGDVTVVAGTIAAGTVVHTPTVQALGVTVAPDTLSSTTLYEHGVFLGDAIGMAHLGPTATFLTHAVVPGPATIVTLPVGPTVPVLWDDGTPVLWDDGRPVLWAGAGTSTATVFAPGIATDISIPGPTIASTALHAPTTVAFIPLSHLGPTSSVKTQLIGQFEVLAEPDEVVWGASGGFSARVDFLDAAGGVIASTDDPDSRIVLVSGSVNEDRTQSVTRECSLRLLLVREENSDEVHPLLPARPGDPLDPRTGGAVAVYAGPVRPSGTPDYVKLGVFKVTGANVRSSPLTGESIDLSGFSQEHEIRAANFWIPTVVLAGTRAVDAIVALVVEAIPDVELTYESSAVNVPGELSWGDGDDRLNAVTELAASVAMEARFDRQGVFRVRAAPQFGDEPEQSPRWTLTEGDRATVRDVGRDISDATLFNGVVVVGEPLDTDDDPVRAEAWDTRPTSPVYYDPDNPGRSLIGPRPKKIVSNLVTTVQQAEAMAAAELAKVLAFADKISVTMAANPEIEAEDVVRVIRSTMGVDALYRVESVTHDLLGGSSQAVCVAL